MVDQMMVEIAYIQDIIYPEHMRVNDVVGFVTLLNDWHERFCPQIGNYVRLSFPIALQQPENCYFIGCSWIRACHFSPRQSCFYRPPPPLKSDNLRDA